MKSIPLLLTTTMAGLALATGSVRAQQTLKTDTAGNPVTVLNLGGGNVTGTLAAARLPAGAGLPVVQTITQTAGSVALDTGTNVAVLTAPLTGTLNLVLPAASAYTAARALIVVDPGGYSLPGRTVTVAPVPGNTLNGGAVAVPILAGTGAASLYPNAGNRWSVGQSYLRAPSTGGLVIAGPANQAGDSLLAVHDPADAELFAVRGSGSTVVNSLAVNNTLSSDAEGISSDGQGGLAAASVLANNGVITVALGLWNNPDATPVGNPPGTVRLSFSDDGLIHARTPDGVDHVLSWTTAPAAPRNFFPVNPTPLFSCILP